MKRLLDGEPLKTDGDLSLVNVAVEAGVSRATVYRAADLVTGWRSQLKDLEDAQDARHPTARLERLKAEMACAAREHAACVRALEEQNDRLAQQVQVLALLLERERGAVHPTLDASGTAIIGSRIKRSL